MNPTCSVLSELLLLLLDWPIVCCRLLIRWLHLFLKSFFISCNNWAEEEKHPPFDLLIEIDWIWIVTPLLKIKMNHIAKLLSLYLKSVISLELLFKCHCSLKSVVVDTLHVSSQAAGRLMEPVPDGLSAHGMCVFVTSQCESPHVPLLKILVLFLALCCECFASSSRWRCLRWISCCHSWRRWAAPAATGCHTPQLQNALLGWLTRGRRVSLRLYTLLLLFVWPQLTAAMMVWWFLLQVILLTDSFRARWRECVVSWTLWRQLYALRLSPSWSG